ncbi:hypothetical protein K523DRAFT_323900 [Schizophyllum commune Tattone D]|nr:hypothetical protein K523DRAFT_323900 [Schizophyllum commune Tattone D]
MTSVPAARHTVVAERIPPAIQQRPAVADEVPRKPRNRLDDQLSVYVLIMLVHVLHAWATSPEHDALSCAVSSVVNVST